MKVEIIQRNQNLSQQREEMKSLAQWYDNSKQDLITKYGECQQIKDRFSDQKINGILDQEIEDQDEQSYNMLEDINGSVQIDKQKLEEECQKYFEIRKKYHRLTIKKQKFNKNI